MGLDIDVSEVRQLASDLGKAPGRVADGLKPVVTKGAVNIKEDQRQQMEASTHFAPVARSIDFDIKAGIGYVEAEVGPRKGSPGSLANIAYFGGSRGGGTVEDPGAALEREAPNFESALSALAAKALS